MSRTKSTVGGRKQGQRDAATVGLLENIASNLWWSWNPDAVALFEYADAKTFVASGRNPIVTVRELSTARRKELSADPEYAAEVARVHGEFQAYLAGKTWFDRKYGQRGTGKIAYFCMEYGLHESLPLYAGGLGVLAGDHLKSASDLGIPLVAIGIYWRRGYTRQWIDEQGRQQDRYPVLPLEDMPVREVTTQRGKPLRIKVPMGDGSIIAGAYRMDVGRIPLYLLTVDVTENRPGPRRLVDMLYSGNRDMRVRQEILLGIGGWRLLKALGIPVTACHLNEGHAAFLSLERIAERVQAGEKFRKAAAEITNTSVFTTHTPVPAGNEEFEPKLVDEYLSQYADAMGIDHEAFHDLARVKPGNKKEKFGMTPLALHTSRYCNGVAALHGAVARDMWQPLYPGTKAKDVPIGHVTNGIHLRTWLHPQMGALLDDFLGEGWESEQDNAKRWAKVAKIPDEALWELHLQLKESFIEECRRYLPKMELGKRKLTLPESGLDPNILTIGFARRFASYKRAALIFTDARRLASILGNRKRPVQIVFAGKAHPADGDGKAIIQQVIKQTLSPRFRGKVVFLEDYEMGLARHMVAGVDMWLNNPQRPKEASGTSGMKPALHGGLNLSILDGWWPEACNGKNGWAIGKGANHDGTKTADRRDAEDLYRVLERQVVPMYYDRGADGLPHRWIACMKNALATIPPVFNSHRQVKEYLTKYYLPAMKSGRKA